MRTGLRLVDLRAAHGRFREPRNKRLARAMEMVSFERNSAEYDSGTSGIGGDTVWLDDDEEINLIWDNGIGVPRTDGYGERSGNRH